MLPIIKVSLVTLIVCSNIAILITGIVLNIRELIIGGTICMIATFIMLYMFVFHKSIPKNPIRASPNAVQNPMIDV